MRALVTVCLSLLTCTSLHAERLLLDAASETSAWHGNNGGEFAGVDEGAWVYLNGELIGERTEQSTGLAPIDFWDKPFSVPVKGLRFGEQNVLVVRVYDSEKMGGIFRAVRLLVDR